MWIVESFAFYANGRDISCQIKSSETSNLIQVQNIFEGFSEEHFEYVIDGVEYDYHVKLNDRLISKKITPITRENLTFDFPLVDQPADYKDKIYRILGI